MLKKFTLSQPPLLFRVGAYRTAQEENHVLMVGQMLCNQSVIRCTLAPTQMNLKNGRGFERREDSRSSNAACVRFCGNVAYPQVDIARWAASVFRV